MSTTISRRGFLYGTSTFLAGASLAKPTLSQQETVKLRILTSTPKALYDDLCGRYMKAHPNVRIEVDTPSPTYDDLTLRVFRSVITNDAPDIIFQGFNRIATISERNLAVPLESFIAGEADWNSLGYQPALQDMTKFLGKSYGLPFAISSPMMYFNAKLVEKAGGDPNALPTTWPEIIRLAKAIKAASPDVLGLQYAYIGHSGAWTWMALVMSAGGQIMSADNRDIGFDSPEGLAAFDLFKQFGEAGQVEMSLDQTWQAFAGGKLGILVTSSSFLNAAEKGAAAGNFKIKTTTLPLAENGRLPVGGNAAMLLATDPVRQKAAWEFMKYMTSPEAQTLLVNTSGYIPANTLVAASPKYLGEYYSTHPNAMVGVKQMPSLTAWPTFPGENSIKITDTIMEYIQSVITLKMEPKDALAAMAGDVRAMLPAS